MFSETEETKDTIKQRMLKVALTQWELTDVNDLDTLVKMLMDALSAELYGVANDIKTAEGRILEKMAHLLAPDLLTMPMPAHAIMQALPAEATEVMDTGSQFCTSKKIATRPDGPLETSVDIYFAPVKKIRLFNADLAYLYVPGSLYNFDRTGNKVLVASGNNDSSKGQCIAYIGINANTSFANLQGMTLFFDPKNVETAAANILYQCLPNTSWYLGNKKISVVSGLHNYTLEAKDVDNGKDYENIMHSIAENITAYYRPKFLTITDDSILSEEQFQYYPEAFTTIFSAATLAAFQQKMIWLRIVFPVSIKDEILNALHVKINAFPVFNCRKNDLRYRLRGGRHIIPIPNVPNENFLDRKSVV